MDPRCAPERVFLAYPPDETTQTAIDLGPPYPIPRFPSPEGLKASPMPPSTVSGCTTRTAPSRLGPSRRPPQCDAQLIAQKQVLGFKPDARLEQVGDKHSERVQSQTSLSTMR